MRPRYFAAWLLDRRRAHWLGATALFLVAAVVQTWPLILHPTDHIMGWPPDSYHGLWSLWWVREAIVERATNPFHSDLLFYPQGTDLYLDTLTFTNGVLSLPLQLLTGNVLLSWNAMSLVFLVLSGLGAYALCARITSNGWASVSAGYIFTFSPFVLMHIHGHWNISTTWPIPLFALFLLRFRETARLREMVVVGGLWAILTYNQFEFAIDALIFLAIFVAYEGFRLMRERNSAGLRALLRGAGLGTTVWLAVSAPLLIPSLLAVTSGDVSMRSSLDLPPEYYSADLLGFVTPSPLWGPGKSPATDLPGDFPTPIGSVEGTVYLGVVPLVLAALALVLHRDSDQRRTVFFWALTFLFFAVMSLGPFLYVGGGKEFSVGGLSATISLPFSLFDDVPVVGLRRAPARMIVFGTLALSVLAGMGLAEVMRHVRPFGRLAGPMLAITALTLVVIEYWNPPVGLATLATPHVYEEISREGGDFAVLDLPVGRITGVVQRGDIAGGALADYSQAMHGKAVIGGYIARAKDRDILWLREQPGLKYLSCPRCPGFPDEDDLNPAQVRSLFAELRIKYVVYHAADPEGYPTSYELDGSALAVRKYLKTVLGLTPIASDKMTTLYKNRDVES